MRSQFRQSKRNAFRQSKKRTGTSGRLALGSQDYISASLNDGTLLPFPRPSLEQLRFCRPREGHRTRTSRGRDSSRTWPVRAWPWGVRQTPPPCGGGTSLKDAEEMQKRGYSQRAPFDADLFGLCRRTEDKVGRFLCSASRLDNHLGVSFENLNPRLEITCRIV